MKTQRISKRMIDHLKPSTKEYAVFDCDIPGFGVRVRPSGTMSYILMYRTGHGRRAALRKFTIGLAGKLTPEQARILAKRLAGDVVHGIDPAAAKTQKRNDQTVGELLDRYIRDHVRVMLKPSTRWSSERLIKGKIRPRFGKTKLKELTRADISSWHRSMSNTPVEANRALACLRKLLSLASGDWELLDQNPARGISPFPEQKRERVPTDEELRKLGSWLALVEADGSELPGCVLAAKLMFFTAMRRGEVLGLEWSFIDLENGSARLPDAKSGRRTVPLGITTVELLKNASRAGKYVCCGFTANEMLSEATFRGFWDRMRSSTGIKGLSAHDLRRGALTRAAIMGLSAFAIRDLAGHRSLAMANRYVQRAGNALRPIADEVSQRMAAALNSK
jgi:integrase